MKLHIDEYLTEMATIFKNKEIGVILAVHPDSTKISGPYFKFANNPNYVQADKIIRILFNKCGYVVHHDGKELWRLNSSEKKELVKILNMPYKANKNYTNWQIAKYEWNYEYLENNLDLEDYYNGVYDETYKDDPSYVPSTLEMPNYLDLVVK